MLAFAWGILGCRLAALAAYLGRFSGRQPRTFRELSERVRALDKPPPYRAARWALFALSLACFGLAIRGRGL